MQTGNSLTFDLPTNSPFEHKNIIEWDGDPFNDTEKFFDGRKHTILNTIYEFLKEHPDFFDISPLQKENFRNIRICRSTEFPEEEAEFQRVRMCYDPNDESDVEDPNHIPISRNNGVYDNVRTVGELEIQWDNPIDQDQNTPHLLGFFSGAATLLCVIYMVMFFWIYYKKNYGTSTDYCKVNIV